VKPGVSIIICAHNAEERIGGLLNKVSSQAKGLSEEIGFEMVVVDSASTDNTLKIVESALKNCLFPVKNIKIEQKGKVKALNIALKSADGDILAIIDDDISPCDDWLKNIIRAFSLYDADVVGGRIIASWTDGPAPSWFTPAVAAFTPVHDMGPGTLTYNPPFSSPVGANFAARRTVFEMIGPFDQALGHVGPRPFGAEESEFSFRAVQSGFRVIYSGSAAVSHPFSRDLWHPAAMLRRAFYHGIGMARFMKTHGLAVMENPWLRTWFFAGRGKYSDSSAAHKPPEGRNALYYLMKTLLYAGYAYGCLKGKTG
jgi:glycosyltransferase involved in cell wall biosynthesis